MAQPPTYQELMAEVYEETAKTVLIHHTEFDEDEEEAAPYEEEDYTNKEIEEREEFNKFAGARGNPDHVIKPKPNANPSGKVSYNIDKHIRTYALNIDGRFRGNNTLESNPSICADPTAFIGSNSANFLFSPSRQYKNIHSIRVTSFEFFNSFYTYTGINPVNDQLGRGNTTLTIVDLGPTDSQGFTSVQYRITLEDGNYVIVSPGSKNVPNNLLEVLQTHIRSLGGGVFSDMTIQLNSFTNIVVFNSVNRRFRLKFPQTSDNATGNGIGYNLGFYGLTYTSLKTVPSPSPYFSVAGNTIVADTIYDAVQDIYVYLKINDYNLIRHMTYGQTEFGAFIKIPLTSPKNSIQFLGSSANKTTAEYFFHQPTNISSLLFEMVDAFGKTLQMNGSTFAITMELQEIMQSDIYEKMLEL
jgi:hypothetical protein